MSEELHGVLIKISEDVGYIKSSQESMAKDIGGMNESYSMMDGRISNMENKFQRYEGFLGGVVCIATGIAASVGILWDNIRSFLKGGLFG